MSAPKKTTSKSVKSPAPATKPAAEKPAARKKAAPAPAVPSVAAPAPKPAPAPAPTPVAKAQPAPAPVPTVKPVATKPVVTTITARVDVGFGNALFVRGDGPGLSWDKGVAMDCIAADTWQISLGDSARAYIFKFLVNDLTWSVGPDHSVAAGGSITLVPEF